MRQLSVLILIFALQLAAAPFLQAESSDPSELFLSAYMSVQNGEKLEFYHAGVLYRVEFPNPRVSSYMWLQGIELLREGQAAGHRRAASL